MKFWKVKMGNRETGNRNKIFSINISIRFLASELQMILSEISKTSRRPTAIVHILHTKINVFKNSLLVLWNPIVFKT